MDEQNPQNVTQIQKKLQFFQTTTIVFFFLATLSVLFAVGMYLEVPMNLMPARPITSWDECVKAKDSKSLLTYPGICVTKDGKRFVQPVEPNDTGWPSITPDWTPIPTEPGSSIGSGEYDCPSREWVNCMPIVDADRQWQCSDAYLSWAKENCPNFKGVAY